MDSLSGIFYTFHLFASPLKRTPKRKFHWSLKLNQANFPTLNKKKNDKFQSNFRSVFGPLRQKKYFKLSFNAHDEVLLTKLKHGCEASVRFVSQEYDYKQNWTTQSPTTNL